MYWFFSRLKYYNLLHLRRFDLCKIWHPFVSTNVYPGESIGLKFIPSQSELFRFIPISVSEPMRIILNQSEKRFVSGLIKNGQKTIRLNPFNSKTSIRMNPNQSETKLSIQINANQSKVGVIRTNLSSDWFGLKTWFGIGSDWCVGINRIKSDWFLTVFFQNDSDWLGYKFRNKSK